MDTSMLADMARDPFVQTGVLAIADQGHQPQPTIRLTVTPMIKATEPESDSGISELIVIAK